MVFFSAQDRAAIHDYMADDYAKNCPADITARTKCHALGYVSTYRTGDRLPQEQAAMQIAPELQQHLSAAPWGYRYVMVENSVFLISNGDDHVVDSETYTIPVKAK